MSEDNSNTKVPAGGAEKIPGFVKLKIKEQKTSKKGPSVARARTSQAHVSTEKEKKIHDLLEPHLPTAVQAWVDGLQATKVAWNQATHSFEDTGLPDHKERRESGRAIVEYVVGKAIERSMEVSGSYKELSELVDELKNSPEAQRLIAGGFFDSLLQSEQSVAKGPAPVHERLTILPPEQKTG